MTNRLHLNYIGADILQIDDNITFMLQIGDNSVSFCSILGQCVGGVYF